MKRSDLLNVTVEKKLQKCTAACSAHTIKLLFGLVVLNRWFILLPCL